VNVDDRDHIDRPPKRQSRWSPGATEFAGDRVKLLPNDGSQISHSRTPQKRQVDIEPRDSEIDSEPGMVRYMGSVSPKVLDLTRIGLKYPIKYLTPQIVNMNGRDLVDRPLRTKSRRTAPEFARNGLKFFVGDGSQISHPGTLEEQTVNADKDPGSAETIERSIVRDIGLVSPKDLDPISPHISGLAKHLKPESVSVGIYPSDERTTSVPEFPEDIAFDGPRVLSPAQTAFKYPIEHLTSQIVNVDDRDHIDRPPKRQSRWSPGATEFAGDRVKLLPNDGSQISHSRTLEEQNVKVDSELGDAETTSVPGMVREVEFVSPWGLAWTQPDTADIIKLRTLQAAKVRTDLGGGKSTGAPGLNEGIVSASPKRSDPTPINVNDDHVVHLPRKQSRWVARTPKPTDEGLEMPQILESQVFHPCPLEDTQQKFDGLSRHTVTMSRMDTLGVENVGIRDDPRDRSARRSGTQSRWAARAPESAGNGLKGVPMGRPQISHLSTPGEQSVRSGKDFGVA